MRSKCFCILDLGASKLAGCLIANDKNRIDNIFFESLACRCISKNRILDISKLTVALSQLLDRLKKRSNLKPRQVYLNISGFGLIFRHNSAVIPLSERGNKLITPADLYKLNQQALALGASWEEEIIQAIPISYNVDDKEGFLNPVGLYAHKLGMDLFTISMNTAYFQTLNHIFNKLGYQIKDIFISGVGILRYILEKEDLDKGVYILLDIGAEVTDIVIYNDKQLLHIGALVFGGDKFTKRISEEFNISFELAEEIKINHGSVLEDPALEDKEIMIKDGNQYRMIPQLKLCQILNQESQLFINSLREYLKKNIEEKKIDKIFACGKASLLDGLLEKLELELGVNVKMVSFNEFSLLSGPPLSSILSIPQFLEYLNCLKVIYEIGQLSKKESLTSFVLSGGLFKKGVNWIKQLYQEYF